MRFLITGFGAIGRRHFRNLLALGQRDILLYRTNKSTLATEELAGFRVESDLGAALANKPDAVIISNPTALHLDVAIPAAEAGCHLLIEKPISHSLERLDELGEAVLRGGGRVLVGFQFRFAPGLERVAELLRQGAIGELVSARVHWGEFLPGWHPWEDYRKGYSARADLGGGVVLTLCHPLDYLRWLVGEVESLWAMTARRSGLDLSVEDVAEIGLKFRNGVLGSVHLNYVQQPPIHQLELIGTMGTIRWDGMDSSVRQRSVSTGQWETWTPPEGYERNSMFIREMGHFLAVIEGRERPRCTLDDGVAALRLAVAALESADHGRSCVFV